MKKFTAKDAKKLSQKTRLHKTFKSVLAYIKQEAKHGHINTFIDVKAKDMDVISSKLSKLGFTVYNDNAFLDVSWY